MSAKQTCDGCGKERYDVKADKVRMPDGSYEHEQLSICFICRIEWQKRKRIFDLKLGRYVSYYDQDC